MRSGDLCCRRCPGTERLAGETKPQKRPDRDESIRRLDFFAFLAGPGIVGDRDLDNFQTEAAQPGGDFVIRFESARAQSHGFDHGARIKFVGGQRIGDPAAVDQGRPKREQYTGEPRAGTLVGMLAGEQ